MNIFLFMLSIYHITYDHEALQWRGSTSFPLFLRHFLTVLMMTWWFREASKDRLFSFIKANSKTNYHLLFSFFSFSTHPSFKAFFDILKKHMRKPPLNTRRWRFHYSFFKETKCRSWLLKKKSLLYIFNYIFLLGHKVDEHFTSSFTLNTTQNKRLFNNNNNNTIPY